MRNGFAPDRGMHLKARSAAERRWYLALLAALVAVCVALPVRSTPEPSAADLEWLESDSDDWSTAHVNEGELEFLAQPPDEAVHHHHNVVTLGRDSLRHGWVQLQQCHHNIDNVGAAQILFRSGRIRNLKITRSRNIGRAWVEDASVQLTDIGKDSSLCLSAESRALTANPDGSYRVNNGPFMRRFLDGYYPMRVTEQVLLADSGLRFNGITPARQPGFEVSVTADSVNFDAWFEGRLRIEIELVQTDK